MSQTTYLDELNSVQRAAVEQTEGAVMIVAGPGSGKTRVLIYRIAHLINTVAKPYQILALTFTNKAAREMQQRIATIIPDPALTTQLWMGTFHAIFARILRIEAEKIGFPTNFSIYDAEDAKSMIETIIKELQLPTDKYKTNVVSNRISQAKNNLLTPQAYSQHLEVRGNDEAAGLGKIADIYRIYAQRCLQAAAMDFDDLLLKTYILLAKNADVLAKYQQKFKYLLIDEFQDTNPAQYAIVKLLAQQHRNICIVGDDAQSIYAFRGATIQNILNFERDYPEMKTFKLEQNYRSTQHIVQIANEVIAANSNQIAKQIWTSNETGNKTRLLITSSDIEEAKLVADLIFEERLRNHYPNDNFAILYRTNSQSRLFEEALRRRNIPYRVYGGMSFYQRKEVKDIMAYLRLIVNPNDEEALRRIINYPTRGIGKTTTDKLAATARTSSCSLWEVVANVKQTSLTTNTKEAVYSFYKMMRLFSDHAQQIDAYETARYVAKQTGLLQELHNDKTVEGISRYENVMELLASIKDFVDIRKELATADLDNSLGAYLQEVSLLTDADRSENDTPAVRLTTIHNAKGLEFVCVFVVGLEEKLFPSEMAARSEQEIEEERRLFYVAVTRAEKMLTLSFASARNRFGSIQDSVPSRFLGEIKQQYLDIRGGKPTTVHQFATTKNLVATDTGNSIRQNIAATQKLHSNNNNNTIITPPPNFQPSNLSKLTEGMTVIHQRFGRGAVEAIDGRGDKRVATIIFDVLGEKRIMLEFSKLMILE
ncbi:MAG: UvrD-helicase domain-containing protein [Chitinophagales bacterium]|nr:UvrD-helicase domain-containing protein [Chitinophagales bacterium]